MEDPQDHNGSGGRREEEESVAVTLEDRDLWLRFHHEGTEMVITRSGRRMFPPLKVRVSGLLSPAKYLFVVDFVPVDNFRYKWLKDRWEASGRAEVQPRRRTFVHPDSPAAGAHWTRDAVSFQRLKLTNNTLDQRGHVVLQSMHRYQPRIRVFRSDGATEAWRPLRTFAFPETAFTAVTAYQNPKITALKIAHNPFAKGFRAQKGRSGARRLQRKKGPTEDTAANVEDTAEDAKQRGSAAEEPMSRGSEQSGADGPRPPSAPPYSFPDVVVSSSSWVDPWGPAWESRRVAYDPWTAAGFAPFPSGDFGAAHGADHGAGNAVASSAWDWGRWPPFPYDGRCGRPE